jgi:threonine/homoserine/homoserine lactone efflux protein
MINILLFIPACFALNLAFGPNNLLALTHGANKGVIFALQASVGRIIAFIPMIFISGIGLGVILSTSSTIFLIVKVMGAAYLIWLGIKLLRNSPTASDISEHQTHLPLRTAFNREILVALGNPKAILIFAAFFPQFIAPEHYIQSYAILGIVFLALELVAIFCYAMTGRILANAARTKLHWFQKTSGIGMILFGTLLLFTQRPNTLTN